MTMKIARKNSGRSAGTQLPFSSMPQLRRLLPFRGIGGQRGDGVVDAARNAAVEIARLEARRDGIGDDDLADRVGQRAFEAIADLEAHLVLLGGDEKQQAVVLLRLAELPQAEEFVGVGLDLLAVERGNGGDNKLDAGFVVERLQLAFERGALRGRDDIGLVDHAPGQQGIVRRRRERRRAENGAEQEDDKRRAKTAPQRHAETPDQNFTFGAACASSVAVNSAIGLLELKKVDAQITLGKVRNERL